MISEIFWSPVFKMSGMGKDMFQREPFWGDHLKRSILVLQYATFANRMDYLVLESVLKRTTIIYCFFSGQDRTVFITLIEDGFYKYA